MNMIKHAFTSIVVVVGMSIIGCTNTPYIEEGARPDAENLIEVSHSKFDYMKVVDDVSFDGYDSIILEPVNVVHKAERFEYEIPEKSLIKIGEKFTEILSANLSKSSGLTVTDEVTANTLRLKITVTDIELSVPKDIDRNIHTKVYSKEPVSMKIMGRLSDATTEKTLVKFRDSQVPTLLTFEEVTKLSVGFKMKQMMHRWSNRISDGLNKFKN